jgi:DNA-binding beta-propeller fold protein YncE
VSPAAPPVVYTSYFPDRQTGIGMINPIPVATNRLRKPIRLNCRGICTLAAAPDGKTVYVAAVDAVIPISTAAGRPGKPIHVPGRAYWIQIDPNGKVAYVTGALLDKVVPINLATNTAGKPIDVGPTGNIAFSPDGTTAYMVNPYDANGTVTPIDTATNTPGKPIPVGPDPYAITITPDGKILYVTSRNAVIPVSTATGTSGTPIHLSVPPVALAVTPDGKTLYVTGGTGHGARLIGVSTATNRPGPPIPVPEPTSQIVFTPGRQTLYLASSAGNGFITPVSTATNQPGKPIRVASGAIMAITPDGKTLYAMAPGRVVPISTATNQPGKPIRFRSKDPQGIIVAP